MAKETVTEEPSLRKAYTTDLDAHNDVINSVPFDSLEAMDSAQIFDDVSKSTKNGLTNSATATIYWERACRVVGQLPEGFTKALGNKDKGKAMLVELLRTKWFQPNATSQDSLKNKILMFKYNASKYPFAVMHVDVVLSPSGYYGPDVFNINPRNFIPQNGISTIDEMDYCHHVAKKSFGFFEDLLENEEDNSSWNMDVIRELENELREATRESSPERDTKNEQDRSGSVKLIDVVTRYEAGEDGRWITFLPKFGHRIIRDIKNPHKNGKLPFVDLFSIPSSDTFYPTSDFQRSMPIQAAINGLMNYYFQAIKRNIAPIIAYNIQSAVDHTIENKPNALWAFNGNPEFRVAETSTAGLSTFQSAMSILMGQLQSIAGTTDTLQNAETAADPGFGKTPEALQMIQQRESTRDAQDRAFLEEALKKVYDLVFSIIPTITEKIDINLFADEIVDICKLGYDDVLDLFTEDENGITRSNPNAELVKKQLVSLVESDSGNQVKLTINPEKLKGLEYRFELEPGTTAKKTNEQQLKAFTDLFGFLGTIQNVVDSWQQAHGKTMNLEFIADKFGILADIDGMEQLFIDAPQMPANQQPEPAPQGQPAPQVQQEPTQPETEQARQLIRGL